MTSASNVKKQAAVLSSLTLALDGYETARKHAGATSASRSNYAIAQDAITFLHSIQPSLDSLTALQPPFPPPASRPASAPLPDRLARFSAWLRDAAPGCGVGEVWDVVAAGGGAEEGNGVVAKRTLAPSSLLMTIPRRAILWASSFADQSSAYCSAEAAAFAAVLSEMSDPMLTAMPSLMLALLLMFEHQRGAASPLHAYLDVLPTHFSLPLYTPPQELRHLSHNPALLSVVNMQCNTLMQYVYIHRILTTARLLPPTSTSNPATSALYAQLPNRRFTFGWQQYRWAVSIMYTRQNRVLDALCLIPGWDMCNHSAAVGSIRTFYDAQAGASSTYVGGDVLVEAGDAVHLFYGARSNRELFVYSGFVDAHNAHCDYEFVWTDDVRRGVAMAAVEGGRTPTAADWERIRGLMRRKAGLDGPVTVRLPLLLTDADWEEDRQRRRQQRTDSRSRRQCAWQQWELRTGQTRSEAELATEAEEDASEERAEVEAAEEAQRRGEERLSQLQSLLRIEALQSKDEAMDALRLQSGTGGPIGQLSSAHEARARQLLLRWLQYEQRLYGREGSGAVEQALKEAEAAASSGEDVRQRALMLRIQLDGLQLLRDAECRAERWTADVGKYT